MTLSEIIHFSRPMLVGAVLVVAVLELVLWMVRRRSIHAFGATLGFLAAIIVTARWFNYDATDKASVLMVVRVQWTAFFLFGAPIPATLRSGVGRRFRPTTWGVLAAGSVFAALSWIDGPILSETFFRIVDASGVVAFGIRPAGPFPFLAAPFLAGIFIELTRVIRAEYAVSPLAWRGFILSLFILVGTAINDLLLVGIDLDSWHLADIGITTALLAVVGVVAANTARVFTELEEDVAAKTEKLAKSVESLRELVSGLPDMIFVIRGQTAQPYNARAEEALDTSDSIPLADLTGSPDELQKLRDLMIEAQAGPAFSRLSLATPEGIEPVEIVAVTVQLGDEEVIVANARSTRERDELDQRLRLTDRLSSLGTMAAGVAHEINNPIAFIAANVEYCLLEAQDAGDRDEEIEALTAALRGTERVTRIVQDLGTFARFDEASSNTIGEVDKAVELAVGIARSTVRHRAELTTELAPDLPTVACESGQLAQVILNLLTNACDAMPESRRESENSIVIEASTVDRGISIRVRDNGIGMSKDAVKRAFDPFFTTKEVGSGTGLGLSISHSIIETAGGSITIDSTVGVGTTFEIVLPVKTDASSVEPDATAANKVESRSILIIDDNESVRRATARLLSREHTVESVPSAEQACDVLAERHFDIILCDIMMPGMNGVEFRDWLEANQPGLKDKLVFFSGGAVGDSVRAAIEERETPMLAKPFDRERFCSILASLPAGG